MEETIGKRISANRKRLSLTQEQLAEKLGVTAQAVSKWENDQSCPDITTLPRLATLFGVTTDALLGVATCTEPLQSEVVEEASDSGLHAQIGDYNIHVGGGQKGAIGFAVFILLTGLLALLSGVLELDVNFWSILWPTALLVFGLFGLWPKFSFFRLGCALLGLYFLLSSFSPIPFALGSQIIWPAVVIFIGLAFLADALKKKRKPTFHVESDGSKFAQSISTADGRLNYSASFGEATQIVDVDELRGGEIHTSFGDYTVSLENVNSLGANCELEVHCSFGELTLLIPKRFTVRPKSSTNFASLDINGKPDPEPQGYISAEIHVSFGEINIEYI